MSLRNNIATWFLATFTVNVSGTWSSFQNRNINRDRPDLDLHFNADPEKAFAQYLTTDKLILHVVTSYDPGLSPELKDLFSVLNASLESALKETLGFVETFLYDCNNPRVKEKIGKINLIKNTCKDLNEPQLVLI
jgi:hypothetical protein